MKKVLVCLLSMAFVLAMGGMVLAAVTGQCHNCHTMHNSQNGGYDNFAKNATVYGALTRGDCIGCHGQGPTHMKTDIPQVLHSGVTDLAGGNFGYITGSKGLTTGTTSTVGHNVMELAVNDVNLATPPGDQHSTGITAGAGGNFTCAGTKGCHGDRTIAGNYDAIKGGHHGGTGGLCDTADTVGNSYRFLKGVKGYENMGANKYENFSSAVHNEYFGTATPSTSSATAPAGNTISGLCAECHGQFHGSNADEIGGTTSPFKRHPTDIVLPAKTEYAAYTTYSSEAPVGRPVLPAVINTGGTNDKVNPGTDIVLCISCHGVHATANEDILRWNYTTMVAGGGGGDTGCFTCHTTKN